MLGVLIPLLMESTIVNDLQTKKYFPFWWTYDGKMKLIVGIIVASHHFMSYKVTNM